LPEPSNESTLPIMVGAVIYVHVSTKEQTENLSLPTQLRVCEEYCRRQGYEVLERGDFESLISEDLFYRVQAVLSGRLPSTTPQQRAHPDFPLRGFVRCESCGRGLTGSWSKGRSEYYAY
jgi:hypothetical protein